ncbi:MAG: flavin reductase family protein [Bacteroidales bacterium]|jgi:flavin reductase (DIM6/NTAB) family NADH-FMN oxidoreductase RutF|nr:flavin reductase family protein [Bacteroidales bacterium]MBR2199601.1 flavin reductase family protein [Bacteroidales bacterium]MBR4272585.1 flavin reductase family protein [Bacteroidales bacterium]
MRTNFGAKALLYPMPVLIIGTYDADGNPDAMNAAWGGIADDTQINICLSPTHKTVANLKATGAFTVSVATANYVAECDYFGIESGNKVSDKIARAGMHVTKSTLVNAPIIDELPFCLECKVISYDDKTCRLLGEIVNVNADESIVVNGKIDVQKLAPITFDSSNHAYIKLGDKVGNAFKDGSKFKN